MLKRTSFIKTAQKPAPFAPAVAPNVRSRLSFLLNPTLLAFVGAVLLACLYGRVAVVNLGGGVVGGDIDGYENLWNDYWTRHALFDLHKSPYFTDFMYYPNGVSLRFHTLHPSTIMFALPLSIFFDAVATTNLIFLISLTLTTFFGYLLIHDFVPHAGAAFVGAALFTYANDQLIGFFSAGQTEKLSAQWLPLYLFFMFRALKSSRWLWWCAAAVVTLVVLSLTDWQYTLYAVFLTLLYFGYVLFTKGSWQNKRTVFIKLAGIGAAYLAIVAVPLVLPMVREAAENPWLSVSDQSVYHSRDLLAIVSPDLTSPGYVVLALVVLGLVVAWRKPAMLFWAGVAVISYILSLGPQLVVAGNNTALPLPYALLFKLPVLSAGRDPQRFYTVTLLAVGLLVAVGLQYLINRLQTFEWPRLRKTVAINAMLVFVLGFSLFGFMLEIGKAELDPFDVPPFYYTLAQDKADYAILDLPYFTERDRGENVYQAYQVVHNKKRFGGRWARDHKLSRPNNFGKDATLLRDFYLASTPIGKTYRPGPDFLTPPDFSKVGLPILNYYNVRYIIQYNLATGRNLNAATTDLIKQMMGANAKPLLLDRLTTVYQVPQVPRLAGKDALVLDLGNGWYEAEGAANDRFRWADGAGGNVSELQITNLTDAPQTTHLKFTAFNFVPPNTKLARTVDVTINGYALSKLELSENAEQKDFDIEVTVPPGRNLISFKSPQPSTAANPDPNQDGRKLSFGLKAIKIQ